MTETPTEETPERHYEVQIALHPYATSPSEAYLMAVDSIIRYGTDGLHVHVRDVESGEQYLMTEDGLVSGEALQEALERLEEQLEEQLEAAGDTAPSTD